MLALIRFVVTSERTAEFTDQAHAALAALAGRPGYQDGELLRAFDDPARWCLATRWDSVGAYRRALNSFDVKVAATPLLAGAVDEPSGYEVLAAATPGGEVSVTGSDRAEPAAGEPLWDRHE